MEDVLQPDLSDQEVSHVGNETLGDFQVFDSRNAINVVAYSVMSAGEG